MKKNRKGGVVLVFLIIIAVAAIAAGVLYLRHQKRYKQSLGPKLPGSQETVEVVIPSGSTATTISKILEDQGIIKDADMFKLQIKKEDLTKELKAGNYRLSPGMSSSEILKVLTEQQERVAEKLVVPEGFEIKNIVQRLEKMNFSEVSEFQELVSDKANFETDFPFLKDLPQNSSLEGYLFPATYEVGKEDSAKSLIEQMLRAYRRVYQNHIEGKLPKEMNLNQLMTMASIVEREARTDKDRPLISSVFYNRLNIKMPLQSCATVQFLLGERKANLSNEDLKIDSPYNTYKNAGLPPGPIANPGLKSIEAALNPEQTDYLFFVLTGEDGSHTFTKTLDEHNKAKKNMKTP